MSGRVYYGDGRTRYLNSSMFFRKFTNDETVERTWLVYSETSGKVYCSACKLFSDKENALSHGFDDWKNVHHITGHENSNAHRNSVMSSVYLARKNDRIDTHLEIQFENERSYWRKVLQRADAIVKFLSQRGLAFRGHNEVYGSNNNGNTFWGLLSYWHNSIRSCVSFLQCWKRQCFLSFIHNLQ